MATIAVGIAITYLMIGFGIGLLTQATDAKARLICATVMMFLWPYFMVDEETWAKARMPTKTQLGAIGLAFIAMAIIALNVYFYRVDLARLREKPCLAIVETSKGPACFRTD